MPLIDHFNLLAPFYDRLIRVPDPEILIRHAALPTPGSLLDAGGGTGRVAHLLRTFAGKIVVADLSLNMLAQASAKNDLQCVCAPTEQLPFPSESFDRLIIVDALHHVHSAKRTAQELWRLVKPGGRIVIEEPDIRVLSVKFLALGEKLALMRSHFLSPQRIAKLFNYPNSVIHIESQQYTAWVIIEKV